MNTSADNSKFNDHIHKSALSQRNFSPDPRRYAALGIPVSDSPASFPGKVDRGPIALCRGEGCYLKPAAEIPVGTEVSIRASVLRHLPQHGVSFAVDQIVGVHHNAGFP